MKTPGKLRWTVEAAALEFVVDRASLASNLRQEEIKPGKDGKFSTPQICHAIYGALKKSRTRMVEAQAAREELQLAREHQEVISTGSVAPFMMNMIFAIKRVILRSALANEDQDRILHELTSINPEEVVSTVLLEAKQQQATS